MLGIHCHYQQAQCIAKRGRAQYFVNRNNRGARGDVRGAAREQVCLGRKVAVYGRQRNARLPGDVGVAGGRGALAGMQLRGRSGDAGLQRGLLLAACFQAVFAGSYDCALVVNIDLTLYKIK
jgi:hypothetical protein